MSAPDHWARTYVLDQNGVPLPCFHTLEWGMWMEQNHAAMRVALDEWDGYRVSTVFLGLDHNRRAYGDPVLYETMVFLPGDEFGVVERYSTRAQAAAGHERIRATLARDVADAGVATMKALRAIFTGATT